MSTEELRILLLDDSATDAEMVQRELSRRQLAHEARWVRNREEFEAALVEFRPHVILADYAMPGFDGQQALDRARAAAPDVPYIFVSGSMGEERAVEALKNGATDYVLKSQLARLVPAVQRAVREAQQRAERLEIEQQFRQSQKMEAVGQLAGGIAHDFNNLLTVISGYVELSLEEAPAGSSLRASLDEVRQAAERAASLTHQLLAFSRKQIISPRILDINEVVTHAEKLLRRLLGEDVDVVTALASGLGHVLVDRGQLEQVLMNLAVNARDAMPSGGRLAIATQGVEIGVAETGRPFGLQPGPHVIVDVSDTGTGMDAATKARIFEPFFTTKGEGLGTGLGLATVYGIMKQSGGLVLVTSELGHGSSFRLYLPVCKESAEAPALASSGPAPRGRETVLLVEDNHQLRALAAMVLRRCGYNVMEASHPLEALRAVEAECADIALMVTDVVMPDMDGRALATRAQAACPSVKVLFMSGHTENALVLRGVLDQGIHFLRKPFLPDDLARRVREVLDS